MNKYILLLNNLKKIIILIRFIYLIYLIIRKKYVKIKIIIL